MNSIKEFVILKAEEEALARELTNFCIRLKKIREFNRVGSDQLARKILNVLVESNYPMYRDLKPSFDFEEILKLNKK